MAFRENEHPRDGDGKFTDKEGGAKSKTEKLRGAVNIYSDDPIKDIRHRQNASYEDILKTGKPKFEKATGFNRLETKHHQRHAKEMGFKTPRSTKRLQSSFSTAIGANFFIAERVNGGIVMIKEAAILRHRATA